MVEQVFKRVAEFLPQDKRLIILNELLNVYNDTKLAKILNCDPSLIQKWKKEKSVEDNYIHKILAIAFYRASNVKNILNETLTEFESLCKELGAKETTSKLAIFMNELDEKSKQIVWYLLRNAHANIRELAELINAKTDNEVLVRVRELINPRAKEIFGNEIMKFEESKIDTLTGEKILYSWWLAENILPSEKEGKLIDVFDENSWIKIIVEMPRVKEEDIKIDVNNEILTISTDSYQKNISLFCPLKKVIEKTYRNGILELRLKKATE
ncbi:MAG: hypothetical protein AB1485_04035 [Candidatus Thermoplasmatota archaeon]